MDVPVGAAVLAAVPIVLLVGLVVARRGLTASAWIAAGVAGLAAATVYGLAPSELGVALVRGVWTGAWILLIVLPALLLFEVLDRSGALDRLGATADQLAPTPGRQALLLAWIMPSFLQGAAGFGAPIAMTAPLLVRRGWAPVTAVATCLVGYQWSVTFGSMGSSYFIAEATARLAPDEAQAFAIRAGVVLAISALVSGAVVVRRARRSQGDMRRMLALGLVMGVALVATVAVQPALGSTVAGLVGLVAAWWLLPRRGTPRPAGGPLFVAAVPYVALTAAAAVGFGVPAVRDVLSSTGALAPVLPGSDAAFGFSTPDAALTPTFQPLLHPLPYVVLATLVGVVAYRRAGWWAPGTTGEATRRWGGRAWGVTRSLVGLTVLSAILVEAGMVAALAEGLRSLLGPGFLLLSAPLGAFGTMLTGSTTASNALFASLQAQVAGGLDLPASLLLTGQTAGGNIGNALSPIVIAVGLAAAGATRREGEVLRRNVRASLLLLAVVVALLLAQAAWLS